MTENVFLFIPNIVDYVRIIIAFTSFYYMPTDPGKASVLYLVCVFLDYVDGPLARMLHQESKFGATLDILTDRIVTMYLCAVLCHLYPSYMLILQGVMALDIFSHWMYMQASFMRGKSHKAIDVSNPILRHYYHNQIILDVMCASNELFFCGLYLCHFTAGPTVPVLGVGLFKLVTVVCFPVALAKNLVNVVQLQVASKMYALMDREERAAHVNGASKVN